MMLFVWLLRPINRNLLPEIHECRPIPLKYRLIYIILFVFVQLIKRLLAFDARIKVRIGKPNIRFLLNENRLRFNWTKSRVNPIKSNMIPHFIEKHTLCKSEIFDLSKGYHRSRWKLDFGQRWGFAVKGGSGSEKRASQSAERLAWKS